MEHSALTNEEKIISFQQQLQPRLMYPLPCTKKTKPELRSIQYQPLRVALNTLGLNSTFPICIVFGDHKYQGLNMNNVYATQGIESIQYYVGHMKIKSETSKLMKIEKDYLEIIFGQGICPLESERICN